MYDDQPQYGQAAQVSQMPQAQATAMPQMPQLPTQQPVQQMSHGGKATAKTPSHFVLGHFSKNELPMLDEWQGGASYIPGTKIRHYKTLEKRFKGDHMFSGALDSHLDESRRSGKLQELREHASYMKKMGRNGDAEVALIGPKTRAYLDNYVKEAKEQGRNHYAEGGDVNPSTEAPEYFNLGSVLSGIGSRISPYVKSAGNWLGNKVGAGDLGTKVTDFGAQASPYIKSIGDFAGQFAKPIGNAIGQKYGMGDLGDQIDNYGSQADSFLNPSDQPPEEGPPTQGQAAVQGAVGKANDFINSPLGQNIGKGAQGAYDTYKSSRPTSQEKQPGFIGPQRAPTNYGNVAAAGVNKFAGNYDTPAGRGAEAASGSYQQNPGNIRQHIGRGAAAAFGDQTPGAQAAGAAARTFGNRGSVRDMAKAGYNTLRNPQQPQNLMKKAYGSNAFDPSLFQ